MATTITSAGITFNDATTLTSAVIPPNAVGATQIANGSVTAEKLGTDEQKQIAKAWVNFDGTTSAGMIRSSYNVSSVTKNGVGNYTVNFSTPMTDANYSISCSKNVTNILYGSQLSVSSLTVNSFAVFSTENRISLDSNIICFQIFGN